MKFKMCEQNKLVIYSDPEPGDATKWHEAILSLEFDKNYKILEIEVCDTILLNLKDVERLQEILEYIKKYEFRRKDDKFFEFPPNLEKIYKISNISGNPGGD